MLAVRYLNRKVGTMRDLSIELYTSKRTILKVHRKVGCARAYDFFSIHRRVKTHSHGGEYSWYYEKYEIDHSIRVNGRPGYRIYKYGHYPYVWE